MKNDITVGQAVGNTIGAGVDASIGLGRKLFGWTKERVIDIKASHEARKKAKEDALVEKIANRMKDTYSCEISPEAKKELRKEIAEELHQKIQQVRMQKA